MKKNIRKIDIPLFIVTAILVVLGLIMVFSSSSISAVLQYNQTEYYFFRKQLIVVLLCIVLFLVIINIPIKSYGILSVLGIIGITLLLFFLKTYGTVVNSANSWFRIGGYSIQPSELAKAVIILFLGYRYGTKKNFKSIYDLFIPLVPCVIIFGFVAIEPDLGTAAIIALICMFIFFSLPLNKNTFFVLLRIAVIGIILVGAVGLNLGQSYLTESQSHRLTFKRPCDRYLEDTGYQVCNGYIAINNGGMLGVGLGKSTQKYLYLPEAHTDFIFPIIVEELGLVGGIVVLFLYMFMLFRILVIARNASNLNGSIIAFGTFAYIFIHIVINIGGLLAIIPETGVPLPLLSFGGTALLTTLVMLSITQRVAIESRNKKKKENGESYG